MWLFNQNILINATNYMQERHELIYQFAVIKYYEEIKFILSKNFGNKGQPADNQST